MEERGGRRIMLVIEGYTGKSLVVQKYLESLNCEKVLLCEKEDMSLRHLNYNNIKPDAFVIRVYGDTNDFFEGFRNTMHLNDDTGFKDVVFYMNTTKDNIEKFKTLEVEFGLNAVLTVQTHDRENPRELSTYTV
jgi:hypothetical protein